MTFFSSPEISRKICDIFFLENLARCVLGLERVCPRKVGPSPRFFFVFVALASSLVSSTPPLLFVIEHF